MLCSYEVNNHSALVFHSTENYKLYNEFKPFTPISDRDIISLYSISKLLNSKQIRIAKTIR